MIITKDSHLDHGLTAAHIALILERFGDVETFTIATVDIPEALPSVECGLYGPLMGDSPIGEYEVIYQKRGNREGLSRMLNRPLTGKARPTRKLSVIIGPHEGQTILYTAFGGPVAPREPFDPSLSPEDKKAAEAFWAEHALAI